MRHERPVLALLLLWAAAPPVLADDFYNRVGAGNLVFATPQGIAYAKTYAPLVRQALQTCLPPGNTAAKFIFVAEVTKTGAQHDGAVRPATTLAQCFATRFTQHQLPPPPLPAYARIDYPLVIEVRLTP